MAKRQAANSNWKNKGRKHRGPRTVLLFSTGFAVGAVLTTALFLLSGSTYSKPLSLFSQGQDFEKLTLDRLITMASSDLGQVDIGMMNMLCAQGLKGSENLDIRQCLSTLDTWAEQIREDTEARLPAYYSNPAKYDNSVSMFKVVNMILALKEVMEVDYDQRIMQRKEFPDSHDVFIHGCLTGKKKGGCISIPTLCVAVGRRLGYPLKLVLTKQHVFFRWDDGKEVFNMEACCPGCDSHPDEYYKNWPTKIDNDTVRDDHLLQSLTPAEELGLFLETRGHCLYDAGRVAEAQVMYVHAYKLMPAKVRLAHIDQAIRTELKKMGKRRTNPAKEMP